MKRAIQEKVWKDTLEEEMRILYVAMTRAKRKLILTGIIKAQDLEAGLRLQINTQKWRATSAMDWLLPILADQFRSTQSEKSEEREGFLKNQETQKQAHSEGVTASWLKARLVYWEEILFFIFFMMWTYFAGFRPQAYGTEKFMDYGFMEAMMRSTTLPARDLWYSEGTINYYYGGQYFAVFLTKLTGSKVELTYNLMRTFVAAFAFVLPFSLVRQMSVDRLKGSLTGKKRCVPAVAGIIAGLSVSIA